MTKSHKIFDKIFNTQNLRFAWVKFSKGKKKKQDVQFFEKSLDVNLAYLIYFLQTKTYKHGLYKSFYVYDPKRRHIHKAEVKDRLVHQALVNIIEPFFESKFIFDSYSSRKEKGTHKAVKRFQIFARKVSRNYTKNCWVLKCDVKKFFDSVNHDILIQIIKRTIKDLDALWLIKEILRSFQKELNRGLPLGNLTSQLFANIYLNKLDQFVKRELQIEYYVRYCDDFVIIGDDKQVLENYLPQIKNFLEIQLNLSLHPNKIIIRKYFQGVEFLGYTCLPGHILPKTKTRRRIVKKIQRRIREFKNDLISEETLNQSIQSYLGFLSHANTNKLANDLKNKVWFWLGR